ncbi:hypothetical protein [Acinetobacter baumannii]|uniref:hypothetical protein n=1 Tax=Acinetobacter baumannii TaxID=470 RepID=UPI000AE2A56D
MDVVDRIVQAPTSKTMACIKNVPKQPIKIVDIKIKKFSKKINHINQLFNYF